ncbi:RNA helicase [Linnemannia elongata]|nr:RNA helicase [Linnemannia elongata]
MLQLVSGLDCTHYTPRHYVVGWDDDSSVEKVHRLEILLAAKSATNTEGQGAGSRSGTGTGPEAGAGAGVSADRLISDIKSSGSEMAYTVHRIPRSRHVHQSMLTTPFTLAKSLLVAMPLIKRLTCLTKSEAHPNTGVGRPLSTDAAGRSRRSVLLMNGPGTCLALALAVIGARMAGVPDDQTPDLVFVESFARVKTLSLAGRLLYPLCDAFLVQWPGLVQRYPRAKYIGILPMCHSLLFYINYTTISTIHSNSSSNKSKNSSSNYVRYTLHSLLKTSATWLPRIPSIHALSTTRSSSVLSRSPNAPLTASRWSLSPSIPRQLFSTTGVSAIYAKRTPRPKQRVVKEQKLKAARSTPATSGHTAHKARFGGKSPSADQVVKSQARQWKTTDSVSGSTAFTKPAPRKRVMSTSISVTSLEKGSRNPQFEHSFAPGFASAYRAKTARGAPLKTGNTGRDKAAAAERTLIEAGAKRKSGPKVRGFVPVRFALKPIASDVNLNLVSTRKIAASKYAMYAQSGSGSTAEGEAPLFAQTQGTVQDMMQQVANSRFQSMGLHPDVEKGVLELLAKASGGSRPTASPALELDLTGIKPTEIQAMSIPASIDPNKKSPYTLCAAETGSGKTLAYLLPVLHELKTQEDKAVKAFQDEGGIDQEGSKVRALNTIRQYNQPRAIILLPSRELVAQVSGILKDLSHTVKLRTLTLSHAMSPKSVFQRLASGPVDVVVATPTSLLDYLPRDHARSSGREANQRDEDERKFRGNANMLEENRLSLASLRYLVIDEADSMFDRGFGTEVAKIVQQAKAVVSKTEGPAKITVVSATLPKKVSDTLDETLPGMLKITTPSLHKSLPGLHQTFLDLKPYFGNRPKAILDILAKQQQVQAAVPGGRRRKENTLIFCNTKHSCEILHEHLKTNKVHGVLGVLHGDATNRDEILRQFTDDDYIPPAPAGQKSTATVGGKILISTDIASRGVDTTAVQHVVLYDFPVTIVDYLHRVGRTARGGRGGRATSLVGRKDRNMAERIMIGIRLGKVLS